MAILKDGKTENLTIKVEPGFKERVEAVRRKYFSRIPMNIFLEMMVEVGIEIEEQFAEMKKEMIAEEAKNRRDMFLSRRKIQAAVQEQSPGK